LLDTFFKIRRISAWFLLLIIGLRLGWPGFRWAGPGCGGGCLFARTEEMEKQQSKELCAHEAL